MPFFSATCPAEARRSKQRDALELELRRHGTGRSRKHCGSSRGGPGCCLSVVVGRGDLSTVWRMGLLPTDIRFGRQQGEQDRVWMAGNEADKPYWEEGRVGIENMGGECRRPMENKEGE